MSELDEEMRNRSSESEGEGDDLRPGKEVYDSSEEDEEDDEEEIQKIRDGFIVDDDEDDVTERKKKKHKRRRERAERQKQAAEEDFLDEDDLDLMMENSGVRSNKSKSKFKRLKRAPTEEPEPKRGDLNAFFSEDEDNAEGDDGEDEDGGSRSRVNQRSMVDELDDFIEEDEFSELDEEARAEARERRKQERLKPTEISGIDSEKVDELYDIFGDGEEYAWALEGEEEDAENEESGRPQLKDIYEPEELKAKLLTDSDRVIRDTDVPERYQELRRNIKEYDLNDDDFDYEVEWMLYQLTVEKNLDQDPAFDREAFKGAIRDALTFITKENLEVPFIFSHRRDHLLKTTIIGEGDDVNTEVQTLLEEQDLWRIVFLDIEFHSVMEKKNQVRKLMSELSIDDDLITSHFYGATEITDLQDIFENINFNYASQLKDINTKKVHRTTLYERVKADRLYEVVQAIGISADQAAENIVQGTRLYATNDTDISPYNLAEQICEDENSLYAKPSQALEVSKHYFAEQLFVDVRLRKYLRNTFRDYAKLSISLTEQGRLKIDKNSPYADFKYAINRAIDTLYAQPDLFLRMLEAESQHLIEIKLEIISADSFFEDMASRVLSDGQSDIAFEWNEFRRSAFDIAIKKLLPLVTLNIKENIRRECERLLVTQVRDAVLSKVDQAPFQPPGTEFGTVAKVLAISPGNGRFGSDAVICSLIDEHGAFVEDRKLDGNPLRHRDRLQEGEIAFEVELEAVIRDWKPDVIGINGYNVQSHKLFLAIQKIIQEQQLTLEGDDSQLIELVWVNDEVALRYQSSNKAYEEFPDKPAVVKYTIALARYMQSPLLEYLSLGADIASLSFHPHQNLLSEERLNEAIMSALVDIVNMTGVDINKCVSNSYLAAALPYVAGLGERKAFGLLRAIQQHPLFSRQALITNENIRIGSTIFLNCASFLRIPQNVTRRNAVRANEEAEAVTLLDDTRIHPEDYTLADKMAADALDLGEDEINELKDAPAGDTIIDRLIEQGTELLQSLILEDYSKQLETTYHKKKRATLQMILEELQGPFAEIRKSYHILQPGEVFESLTGDSPDSFHIGVVLPISIKRVNNYEVSGLTSNQIYCTANSDRALERGDTRSLPDIYTFGQAVPAKLLNIDYEKFAAEVSLLKRDIQNPTSKFIRKEITQWNFDQERYDEDIEKKKEETSKKANRIIKHPNFQNFSAVQAQNYLAPKERGSVVIRPSSKGNDHIAVTWKVDNNLFQHVDVVEHDKESDFSLGRRLVIGNTEFSDLDEIIETYVGEIVKKVNEMTNHDKFRKGTKDEVTQWLDNYAKANPKRASYAFALDHKRPGWFLLLFKTSANSKMYIWNVKAIPNGFELHGYPYPDMTLLCNGFKTLIKSKLTQKQTAPQRGGYTQNYTPGGYGGYNNYGGQQSYGQPSYGAPGY
ncbi:Transcription elongation factor [Wickerhamomyces ciferrii]|uniref:Transcription elongation factor Spt6 n=1 Tax=Wickerhamomyces ciferrii (strain ATCC 14091 / BCRC 22168 / CBS 111 / JCM 3599 / NBRC 0793 / NRRL Y-1031 F-60-10) TaxID=1206466 RepID=K0KHD0_WICCF|nr:Transcription elongation factor [Wickerhamomyces ciferrii]CCH41587.1 Transcription elongation factor [Wickerhamomyces ciferrii]